MGAWVFATRCGRSLGGAAIWRKSGGGQWAIEFGEATLRPRELMLSWRALQPSRAARVWP